MKKGISKVRFIYSFMIIIFIVSFMEVPKYVDAAVSTLSAPSTIKAVSSSYNSVSISWSGVSGAKGYSVYRATSSKGTYTLVTTTTDKSYKNTGLTTGKVYYYKVRAYTTSSRSKVYGKYSSVKSVKAIPATPGSIMAASSSYSSNTISWDKVTGASAYRVYVATSKRGTYTRIVTTTATSYKNTGLVTGKTYYYKVRAYRTVGSSKVFGHCAAVVNASPVLAKPSSLKVEASADGTMDISWGKTSGANGYRVYQATSSSGSYEYLATINTTSYQVAGLTSGETYYYLVRAYRVIGSSKVYSICSWATGRIPITKVSSISLNQSIGTIIMGNSVKLTATITPQNATNQSVTWESSDSNVATVNGTGTVTSIGEGTAIITVTTEDGSKTSDCTITVNPAGISGIDVSKWQGTIKWDLVKSDGIEFAMIRASYGSSNVDPMFETNYAAAKENEIAVGAYHYSHATTVEKAAEEVDFLIRNLEGKQFEYPICVDIEDYRQSGLDTQTLSDIVLTYLNGLNDAGYYPIIYSSKSWFTSRLVDTRLDDYDHWLAQWGASITYPGKVDIWQYSSTGSVSGISGNVDLDTSFVDYPERIKSLGLNGF